MNTLQLTSGFTFDYTNLYGPGKVTAEDLEEQSIAINNALAAAQLMRTTGVVKGHLSKDGEPELVLFPQLPYIEENHINSPEVMQRLGELGIYAREHINIAVSLGIGGSYLGDKVIFDIHCGEFWNSMTDEERQGYPKLLFSGNNVDPRRTADIINFIKRDAANYTGEYKAMLIVISKSGSTIEPMSNLMIIQEALDKAGILYDVVAVTDPHDGDKETLLHKLATEKGWPMFSVPDGVGGRFSVFTEVGLVVGAVVGFPIQGFLDGAKSMDMACQNQDIFKNPALLNAALKYIAGEKYGRYIEVFMSYGDYLKSTSEWYVQLLAESLGKKVRRDGRQEHYGRTPIVAVGTTDMHAQTQEHQEGRMNKVVQFLQVAEWDNDLAVPPLYENYNTLAGFSGLGLSEILAAAKESNAAALTGDNRFNASFILPKLTAYHMGELMFLLCWSIFFEGELADVDAFDQPGVEVYKKLLGPKLKVLKGE